MKGGLFASQRPEPAHSYLKRGVLIESLYGVHESPEEALPVRRVARRFPWRAISGLNIISFFRAARESYSGRKRRNI
jgi:hypothetical protein